MNGILRHPGDRDTTGSLPVKGKDRTVAEYSPAGFKNPVGAADRQERLEEKLQVEPGSGLPTAEEIEREPDLNDDNEKDPNEGHL